MSRRSILVLASVAVLMAGFAVTQSASGEQATSRVRAFQAGLLDAGRIHACAALSDGSARCWGNNLSGQLGYGNTTAIGDTETPASAGAIDVGAGRTVRAIGAGDVHSCALLDNGTVRCWGSGSLGRLGYGNNTSIGDNESPASAGPVDLGIGRTARAITVSPDHSCAILDDGSVRCWGVGVYGQLGYGNTNTIGDNETPGSVVPVNLGPGRTAVAISAGDLHTCAVLDNGNVLCWGAGALGRLGYANEANVGDNESPASVGPVSLGRPAVAVSAGGAHTCALLDDGNVRCWGSGGSGRLGNESEMNIGDVKTPTEAGPPVQLGGKAIAISAGGGHSCALLDNGGIRCWGNNGTGALGYANTTDIGDNEAPSTAPLVSLAGPGTATAISAGSGFTCALRSDGQLLCWGTGNSGQLGYANTQNVGDDEEPRDAGTLALGGTLVPAVADLSLSIGTDAPAREVGRDVHLTVSVANGGADATGAKVADTLPAGLVFAGAVPSQGTYSAQTGEWQVGTVSAGQIATLRITARVATTGTFTDIGEVTASNVFDPDSTPGNGAAGEDDRATVRVTGTPAPPPDTTRPAVTSFRLSRSRFAAASHGGPVAGAALVRIGTTVRYRLSEPAKARFRVKRLSTGRLVHGRCVRTTARNRSRPRCTLARTLKRSFTDAGELGANRFKFTGRLGGRKLRPGRYRLVVRATDAAGNRSAAKRVRFRIVRR